eukprot:jgi/Galph1/1269/GphlegSOOS_G6018.1
MQDVKIKGISELGFEDSDYGDETVLIFEDPYDDCRDESGSEFEEHIDYEYSDFGKESEFEDENSDYSEEESNPIEPFEADSDRRNKATQSRSGISVRWEVGLNNTLTAYFVIPLVTEGDLKIHVGDELLLQHTHAN